MTKWPERTRGWEDALILRTRNLLEDTAKRFGLDCKWDASGPVEVACRYPAQAGLDFDLGFSLSHDEFICWGEHWYADIFPADDEGNWNDIVGVVEGLVSGDARVLLYHALGRTKPYWTEVQVRRIDKWASVSTGVGCAVPPIIRPIILQNGLPPRRGNAKFAYGSILLLLVVGAAAFMLMT